jgi:L-amino acid N-acyltransferase YncA
MIWHKFAELSTYVAPGNRERGIGRNLLLHAIADAKNNSDLAYLLGFVSEGNPHVQRLVQEVGFQRIAPLPRSQKDDVLGGPPYGEVGSRLIVYCVAL